MKEPFIFLCSEVSREHAMMLIRWLKDEEVIRYLSDSHHVSDHIEQVMERTNLPFFTQLFNRDGRFYMACDKRNRPVGFVRLIEKGGIFEIVIVIGDRDNWNRKLGTSAIRESMKVAFLELRAKKMVAKIRRENKRSIRAFVNAGFKLEKETGELKIYGITMEHYLQSLKGVPAMPAEIYITSLDRERIGSVLGKMLKGNIKPDDHVKNLEHEINRAIVVQPQQIPGDVITMNSKVLLELNDEDVEVSLVYPEDADISAAKLSIFSPIGTAILGYREGNTIEWEVPSGISRIYIKKLLYQPEAAGDYCS